MIIILENTNKIQQTIFGQLYYIFSFVILLKLPRLFGTKNLKKFKQLK